MGDKFKAGEVCIGCNFVGYTALNGVECEVVRQREMTSVTDPWGNVRQVFAYLVIWKGMDYPSAVEEKNLRKKDDPQQGDWSEIEKVLGWNPTKEMVTNE